MNAKILVVILAVLMLFTFGCTGGSQQPASKPASGGTGTAAGTGTPTDGAGTGTTGGSTGGQTTGGTAGGTTGGTSVTDLTGKKMAELVALGIPIQCNLHYKDTKGNSMEYVFYMKGEKIRAESQVDMSATGAGVVNVVTIMNGDNFVYSSIPNPAGCDWVKITSNSSGSASSSFQKPEDLDNLPSTTYECTPAAFGDEKFATTGKVCTIEEAYQITNPTN